MKIITVTSQSSDNYGAILQAYALQQTLFLLGYENEILDIRLKHKKKSIKVRIQKYILHFIDLFHFTRSRKLAHRFQDFRNNYLKQTKQYNSITELRKNPPNAEIYLTGSDQVFALGNALVPARFLDFGSESVIRVSYAASKGTYEKDEKSICYLRERLSNFSMISMREELGTEYVQEVLHFESITHIDPVFLLDENSWNKIISEKRISGKYILCYRMLNHTAFAPLLKKLKKKTGYQVISIQPRSSNKICADQYLYDVTPQDFIQLIRDAEVVVTSSFHATAFSIIFRKKFYSLIDYKPERATNLCKLFNVENRLVKNNSNTFSEIDDIDYSNADLVIRQKRMEAVEYLKKLKELVP